MSRPIRMGILGGMGPMATSFLFERIVQHTAAEKDQDHIDLVIVNRATMPDRTAAIQSGNVDEFLEQAVSDCLSMEQMGVGTIAVPCNTSHYFYDAIQSRIHAELIHMVRETVLEAKRPDQPMPVMEDERGTYIFSAFDLNMLAHLPEMDVLYMTRVQRERFFNEEDYLRLKDTYVLTPDKLKTAKPDLCIMHPLPRVNEISVAIDDDPRACYFKQVLNGKYMRMALILKLLKEAAV